MPAPELRPSVPAIAAEPGGLPGVQRIESRVAGDARGSFSKVWHAPFFHAQGIDADWRESYWSTSAAGVVRGMHFQAPPVDHDKLVTCVAGAVLDVLLDLRPGAGYGRSWGSRLAPGEALFIPRGIAHGFLALEPGSTLFYQVTSVHHPDHDLGVRWDSFGFDWGVADPLLSERDRRLPALADLPRVFP